MRWGFWLFINTGRSQKKDHGLDVEPSGRRLHPDGTNCFGPTVQDRARGPPCARWISSATQNGLVGFGVLPPIFGLAFDVLGTHRSCTGSVLTGVCSLRKFMIHSQRTTPSSSSPDTTRTLLLLLGVCHSDRLKNVEVGFGVGEFLDLFDLQAPVFVGNDVRDEDRFTDRLNSDRGIRLVGELWG